MSMDLRPFFAEAKGEARLELVRPGRETLDRWLEMLSSKRANDRHRALGESVHYLEDLDRVVPALLELLDREGDEGVRRHLLYALADFPGRVAPHAKRFAGILLKGSDDERGAAAWLLGAVAPDTPFIRRVLAAARKDESEYVRQTAGYALERIRARASDSD